MIPFNTESFLKRIDRELASYEVYSSVIELILNKYFQETDEHMYLDEFFNAYMEHGHELDLKLVRSVIRSTDFKSWAEYYLPDHMSELSEKFTFSEDGKRVIIYRSITTNYDWIDKARTQSKIKAGIFWSFSYNTAIPHWGNSSDKNTYVFSGDISFRDVDWFSTILLNLSSLTEDEQEIRTFSNRKIKDFKVNEEGNFFVITFSPSKHIVT